MELVRAPPCGAYDSARVENAFWRSFALNKAKTLPPVPDVPALSPLSLSRGLSLEGLDDEVGGKMWEAHYRFFLNKLAGERQRGAREEDSLLPPASGDGRMSKSGLTPNTKALLRVAFTEFHNSAYGVGSSSGFLGDKLSFHSRASMPAHSRSSSSGGVSTTHVSHTNSFSAFATLGGDGSPSSFDDSVVGYPLEGPPSPPPCQPLLKPPQLQQPQRVLQRCERVEACDPMAHPWVVPCILAALPPSARQPQVHRARAATVGSLLRVPPRESLPPAATMRLCAANFDPFEVYLLEGVRLACPLSGRCGEPASFPMDSSALLLTGNFLFEYPATPARTAGNPHNPSSASGGSSSGSGGAEVTRVTAATEAPVGFAALAGCSAKLVGGAGSRIVHVRVAKVAGPAAACGGGVGFLDFYLLAGNGAAAEAWVELLRRLSTLRLEDAYELRPAVGLAAEGPLLRESVSQAMLGHGRFACVKSARRVRSAGRACALKIFDKAEFWRRAAAGQERFDTLVREAVTQAMLTAAAEADGGCSSGGCPIVRLQGVLEDADLLVLELEIMSARNLFHELSHDGVMSEPDAARIAAGVLEAVVLMQRHGVAHRDIKLSNILFPAKSSSSLGHKSPDGTNSWSSGWDVEYDGGFCGSCSAARGHVRVADFGMAGLAGADGKLRGRCGTPGYVAPEILAAGPSEPYDNVVDVYSVGVVTYTLLCGYEPFWGRTDKELAAQNREGEYAFDMPDWGVVSMDAQDFVARLMEKDPRERISPEEALQHPWLQRHIGPAVDIEPVQAVSAAGMEPMDAAMRWTSSLEDSLVRKSASVGGVLSP